MADTSSTNYITTVGGYAAILGASALVYWVSQQKKRPAPAPKTQKTAVAETRKDDRKKKQRMESYATVAQENKAKSQAQPSEAAPVVATTTSKEKPDNGANDREFAKQLAKAKEGTKFSNKSDGGKQREKSVKQSRAANLGSGVSEEKVTTAVVETPAEPSVKEAPVAVHESAAEEGPVDVSGVADMLEPTPPGPSILRLTDTADKKQKTQTVKAPEPVESKKQRQNRKKAEASKAAREESEKERKTLEEKQRRQARVAEGRAAKDGSQFMAAVNGTTKSVWESAKSAVNDVAHSDVLHKPLDTFEQVVSKKSKKTPEQPKAAPTQQKDNWTSSLPSEEEQIQQLKDDADEWNTVTTKKPAKKSSSVDSGDEPVVSRPAPQVKQSVNGSSSKTATKPQNFGSFSALSSKNEPTEEVEEEWDV